MTAAPKDEAARPMPAGCKVAIVGAGNMSRQHIRAFQDIPGVQVLGITSRTRARAEALAAEYGVPGVYDSIADLYEGTKADLVVVSVPELSGQAVFHACFEHPWTSLIEKPAGYTVEIAEEIEAAARTKGRRAFVGLNRRHYGSIRAVLADLPSHTGPRLIKIHDQENPAAGFLTGQPREVCDNWMYGNAIHLTDLFAVFGRGAITDITPVIRWTPDHPQYVAAKVTYESGDIGLYDAVWNAPAPWIVSVQTPTKRYELRPIEQTKTLVLGTRVMESVPDDPYDIAFKPGLRRQAELAVRAAAGQKTELPTLREALESMYITRRLYATD